MDNYYLYGAKSGDERYYDKFLADYASTGNRMISDIRDKSQEVAGHNQLLLRMQQGINNARILAKNQVNAFGYKGNIQNFCDDFNKMLKNFEILAYRLLEEYANTTAYDLLELEDPWSGIKNKETDVREKVTRQRTLDEIMTKVAGEEKIKPLLNAMEKDIDTSAQAFFNNIYHLIDNPDPALKKHLDNLLNSRKGDLSRKSTVDGVNKRNFQYRPDFGGKLGELENLLVARGIAATATEFVNSLVNKGNGGLNSNTIKIVGTAGNKVDLLFGSIGFSTKNYTALRERFMFDSTGKEFPDIKIQSSGFLGSVLENFAKDKGGGLFSKETSAEYFSFIMNAIYLKQYGIEESYSVAKEALDLLVNTYAYVFLTQGTASEELGYSLLTLNKDNSDKKLPGFMWIVGKGIIPIYRILIEITDNFKKILNRDAGTNRSGVYTFIKISNQAEAVSNVDSTSVHETYPNNDIISNQGTYYRRSKCYPRLTNPPDVLTERYKDFANTVKTSIKINMQIDSLEKMMSKLKPKGNV